MTVKTVEQVFESLKADQDNFQQKILEIVQQQSQNINALQDQLSDIHRKQSKKGAELNLGGGSGQDVLNAFIAGQDRASALFTNMFAQFRESQKDMERARVQGEERIIQLRANIRDEIQDELDAAGDDGDDVGEMLGDAMSIGQALTGKTNGAAQGADLGAIIKGLTGAIPPDHSKKPE